MSFSFDEYYNKLYDFDVIEKAIIRKNATKDQKVIDERTENIVRIYNSIIKLAKPAFESDDKYLKLKVRDKLVLLRDRIIKDLGTLGKNISVPRDLTKEIDITKEEKLQEKKMTTGLSKLEYYNLCARTLNSIYSGDPLGLTPFINSINLLISLDTNKANESVLKDFVLSKLQGIAIECIPENATIEIIKKSLRENIKTENSKIITGKLMASRADKTNFADYTKKTEQLAEQLNRALILEGIPSTKAKEMTVDKTIELCRANTSSNIVKSVLSSTKFEDPKEVIAKYIIESRVETNEQNVYAYRSNKNFSNQSNRFQRGKKYFNNNYRNNQNNNQNSNQRSNNYNGNYNGSYSNNNRGFNRNRGRGRGRQNFYNNNNNRGNRVYYAENETAPPSGAAQAQQVSLNQADNNN